MYYSTINFNVFAKPKNWDNILEEFAGNPEKFWLQQIKKDLNKI